MKSLAAALKTIERLRVSDGAAPSPTSSEGIGPPAAFALDPSPTAPRLAPERIAMPGGRSLLLGQVGVAYEPKSLARAIEGSPLIASAGPRVLIALASGEGVLGAEPRLEPGAPVRGWECARVRGLDRAAPGRLLTLLDRVREAYAIAVWWTPGPMAGYLRLAQSCDGGLLVVDRPSAIREDILHAARWLRSATGHRPECVAIDQAA